jgi:(E)-4-hydroxy-3-methylbut-2-enyl-diphosphate synthase
LAGKKTERTSKPFHHEGTKSCYKTNQHLFNHERHERHEKFQKQFSCVSCVSWSKGFKGVSMILRRKTRQIHIGSIPVGDGAPITVQSMTNTKTSDANATLKQIDALAAAGCEIIRVALPDMDAAKALPEIVKRSSLPLIADIHFDHKLALSALDAGVAALRLNPGNMKSREHVVTVVDAAKASHVPIRIGVNGGSLDKVLLEKVHSGELSRANALVESALGHVRILEELDFFDIKISLKASDVLTTVAAYRALASRCDYPFHVGITEAGTVFTGTIKSSAGIGILLMDGLCDTIRVSLSGDPVEEVRVARRLLQAMGERPNEPTVISCPTCGRAHIDVASLANQVEKMVEGLHIPLTIAVMGCEVNGPGEAREADLGVAGGAQGGLFFRKGEIIARCPESEIMKEFEKQLEKISHG